MLCSSWCLGSRVAVTETPLTLAWLSEGMLPLGWMISIQMGKGSLVEVSLGGYQKKEAKFLAG